MRIKVLDVDVRNLGDIHGLAGYDAIEILFRFGWVPIGRTRIPCDGDFFDLKDIKPLIDNLPAPSTIGLSDKILPTVTVAICTRNRRNDLTKALYSLNRQEYHANEILIIDNGCQQEINDLVDNNFPNAIYLAEHRLGLDFARNRATIEAKGDIIAFLDDDCEADPYWVRSLAECFAKYPEVGAVTGLILPIELETDGQQMFEDNGGFGRGFLQRILPEDCKRKFGLKVPVIAEAIGVGSGCNMAFRTSVLKELRGFDQALDTGAPLPGGGDLDIFYRVLRAGFKLVYEPRALVRHCHRRSKEEFIRQLTGHHRSLFAFLVKTIINEHGLSLLSVVLFLIFRLIKINYRLVVSLVRQDPLPFTFIIRILIASFIGLGSYHASKIRTRRL